MKLFASLTAAATVALSWQIALDTTVKGLALLALAGGVILLMRRQSASARHHVWLLAMTALLLLPVLSLTLPKWRILPPELALQAPNTPEPTPTPRKETAIAPAPVVHSTRESEPIPPGITVEAVDTGSLAPTTTAPAAPEAPKHEEATSVWPESLLLAWLLGALLLLGRMGVSALALHRLRRKEERLTSGPLFEALTRARIELQHNRPVALSLDERRTMPMSWGIISGNVLLPAEATSWSPSQLQAVLRHEVGHLKRRDPSVQVLVQLVCALHWFNPLVWLAAWRLRTERERACDDLVLESGMKATDYAQHLLDVAAGYRSPSLSSASAVAMARHTRLEGRLRAIMSDQLNRRSLTRTLVTAFSILGAAIVLPFAMLEAQPEDPEEPHVPTEAVATDGQTDYQPGKKPSEKPIHRPRWGKTTDGLQAGVFFQPEKKSYAIGDTVTVHTMIRNVAKEEHLFSINRGIRAPLGFWAQDSKGGDRHALKPRLGGRPVKDHFHLQPGEEVEINKLVLKFVDEHNKRYAGASLQVIVGESYRGAVSVNFPKGKQDPELDLDSGEDPPKLEWAGELTSGKLAFAITAPKPQNALLETKSIPASLDNEERKKLLDTINELNRRVDVNSDPELQKRIEQYEAAFKLQTKLDPLLQNVDNLTPAELAKAIEELAVDTRASVGLNDPGIAVDKHGNMIVGRRKDNELWKFETREEVVDVSIIGGSVVLVIDQTGTIYGVDLRTGKLRWEQKSDQVRRLENKQPKEPELLPIDPEPAPKPAASAELIKTWTELVEARKLAELQAKADLKIGKGSTTDLIAAQEAMIDARIGHAKAAGLGLPQLAKLHEERVAILKHQEKLMVRRYQNGEQNATEVQKIRSRVLETRIKLLEVQKAIEERKVTGKGRPSN